MIDAKTGGLPTDRSKSTSPLPSRKTTFGTHPIGTGAQRGWFVSGLTSRFGYATTDPRKNFYASTAAFYTDCGRNFNTTNFDLFNLGPNANIFSTGTAGDPLSFVAKSEGTWTRPNGSLQSAGIFDQVSTGRWEGEMHVTDYPAGYGTILAGGEPHREF